MAILIPGIVGPIQALLRVIPRPFRPTSDRQKTDDVTLETSSKYYRDRRYRLPALVSVQARAEDLPQGKSGYTCDGREVRATCRVGYARVAYVRAMIFFSVHIKRHTDGTFFVHVKRHRHRQSPSQNCTHHPSHVLIPPILSVIVHSANIQTPPLVTCPCLLNNHVGKYTKSELQ